MSYWTDILALTPDVLWKESEAAGPTAVDASSNARDGTYGGTPDYSQASIIPNTSNTSVLYGANSNDDVSRAAAGVPGLTINFTMFRWIRPSTLGPARRELFGKIEGFQLWLELDGALTFYCTPAWSSVATASPHLLAINTNYFVAVRKNTTHMSVWINGVKRAELSHAATPAAGGDLVLSRSSTAPVYYHGRGQGSAYWSAAALSDANILALYNSGIAIPDEPPTTPGAFINPIGAQVVDTSTILEWGASTDPEDDAINYEGEYTVDGVAWLTTHAAQAGLTYNLNTSAIAYTALAQVRVRATGSGGPSAWRTSAVFTIQHVSNLPVTVLTAPVITNYSVLLVNTFVDPDAGDNGLHYATQVQLDIAAGDFSAPKVDTGWVIATTFLLQRWLTGLPPNTALKARVRVQDKGGQIGLWSAAVSFTTRRILSLGAAAGFNQDRNEGSAGVAVTATYGENTYGVGFTPNYPDLRPGIFEAPFDETGVRLRWTNTLGLYAQMTEPGAGTNCIRYGGALLAPISAVSFVLVFHPEYFDPAAKSLIFGSETWWIHRSGTQVVGRGVGYDGAVPVENFLAIDGLLNYQPNILMGTYLREVMVNSVITTPGKFVLWLNGIVTGVGSLHAPPIVFPTTSIGGDSVSADMRFSLGTAPHNYLWLGTQSSDGARGVNDSNYYSYAGGFIEFAWWTDKLFTDDDAEDLYVGFTAGRAALRSAILDLEPVLYDRILQPMQPSKPTLEADLI